MLNLIKKDEEINFLNMSVLLPPIDPVETAKQVWPWFWYPFIFVMKYLWPFLLVGILWKIFEKKLDTSVQNFKKSFSNKKCPYCLSWIPKAARTCRHCGKDV